MKCNICQKDFGDGIKCQHCGTDRVTALGNYQGYTPNVKSVNTNDNLQSLNLGSAQIGFEVCYVCGEVIPTGSIYCPCCGKKLFVECPKCNNKYSSQYKFCPNCGTNRADFDEKRQNDVAKVRHRETVKPNLQMEQPVKSNYLYGDYGKQESWALLVDYRQVRRNGGRDFKTTYSFNGQIPDFGIWHANIPDSNFTFEFNKDKLFCIQYSYFDINTNKIYKLSTCYEYKERNYLIVSHWTESYPTWFKINGDLVPQEEWFKQNGDKFLNDLKKDAHAFIEALGFDPNKSWYWMWDRVPK